MSNIEQKKETVYLTVLAAASYLDVRRETITRLISKGTLTAKNNPVNTREKLIAKSQLDEIKEFMDSTHIIRDPQELQQLGTA